MKKFRKKPVEVEVMRIEAENVSKVLEWIGGKWVNSGGYDYNDMPFINITTLEGTMTAKLGDYIIKGVKGELYPCKPDIFEMTYEEVPEETVDWKASIKNPPLGTVGGMIR